VEERVFGCDKLDNGEEFNSVHQLHGKIKGHFFVSGSQMGQSREDWPWVGEIVAPCGCRLMITTSAHKTEEFSTHIFGLIQGGFIVAVNKKCESAFVLILQKMGWEEMMPPTYGWLSPDYPIPPEWKGYEEKAEKDLAEMKKKHFEDVQRGVVEMHLREYEGVSFVSVGRLQGRGKSLTFLPLEKGKLPEDYGFANPS